MPAPAFAPRFVALRPAPSRSAWSPCPSPGVLAGVLYTLLAPVRRAYRDRTALAWVGLFGGLSLVLAPHRLASLLPWLGWLALGTAFVLVAQRWSSADAGAAGVGFALGAVVTLGWEARQRLFLGQARPEGFTVHPNLEAGLLLAVLGAVATLVAARGRSRAPSRRWRPPSWRRSLRWR